MLAFPPVLPDPAWRFTIQLPRDHYVPVDTNDYSVGGVVSFDEAIDRIDIVQRVEPPRS